MYKKTVDPRRLNARKNKNAVEDFQMHANFEQPGNESK